MISAIRGNFPSDASPCNPSESAFRGCRVKRAFNWGCALPSYRLYRLDGSGKIVSAEWVDAEDDAAAAQQARDRKLPVTCEMWERNRLVARINPQET